MAEHHNRIVLMAMSRSAASEPTETVPRFLQPVASLVARARSRTNPLAIVLGIIFCFTALAPSNAYAYLDPGTGTFALQGLIAGIAGGVLGLRAYWRRIRGLFRRPKATPEAYPERPFSGRDA